MSDQGYEDELRAERDYVAGLYDAAGRRAGAGEGPSIDAALLGNGRHADGAGRRGAARGPGRRSGWTSPTTGCASAGWTAVTGEHSYIGRIGLFDEDERLRAGAAGLAGAGVARRSTWPPARSPENMRRRRQFHTRGRTVVDFTDEVFGTPGGDERGDAALLAAVNAPRGEGMRDIVATIQAEQDEIIRLDHPGVLVIEGGPGTGQDRGGAAPRRVPAVHAAGTDGTPRRAGGRAESGVPHPHRPGAAVARRVRRGVHDARRSRAGPARHRRGHAGGRAAEGFACDPGRARGRDRRPRSGCRRSRS